MTFPVSHGETMNLVAFVTADKPWPSEDRLTLPATREEALEDFKEFGPNVLSLIRLTKSNLDRVSATLKVKRGFLYRAEMIRS